jgi:hypothetical protein
VARGVHGQLQAYRSARAQSKNLGEAVSGSNVAPEPSVHRVTEPGKQDFALTRKGEKGVSVFAADQVGPEDILPHFREGSGIRTERIANIETRHALTVVPTPGDVSLPSNLQAAHMEIRPGPDMSRKQFKQALKDLSESDN